MTADQQAKVHECADNFETAVDQVTFEQDNTLKDARLGFGRSTAAVGILITGARAFNHAVTRENLPVAISKHLFSDGLSQTQFLLAETILFLVIGCLIEAGVILSVVVPHNCQPRRPKGPTPCIEAWLSRSTA